jgi:hypothetical protein
MIGTMDRSVKVVTVFGLTKNTVILLTWIFGGIAVLNGIYALIKNIWEQGSLRKPDEHRVWVPGQRQ